MGDPFTTFISELLDSKEWSTSIDPEGRRQLEEDLRNRLMDQIDRAVIDALPEDKIDGLNELLDREVSPEEIQQYVASAGINVQAITAQTMLRFRELYLGQKDDNNEL